MDIIEIIVEETIEPIILEVFQQDTPPIILEVYEGEPGDSAYQVAVKNGYVGTQTQWLNSLKGAQGAQGPQGPAGSGGTNVFTTDIVVNGVNIGAGGGNDASNVRIGQGAGASLGSGGTNNILIGRAAGSSQNKDGSTVIGGRVTPDNSIFNQDNTLSVGKLTGVPLVDVDSALPHIWAPDVLEINYSSSSNILVVSQTRYSAIFIDYVISVGDISLRAGTIKAVWNNAGIIKWTEEATDSIGDTSGCTFSITYNNINNTIRVGLTNPFGATKLYCNFTSRLLTKPKLV